VSRISIVTGGNRGLGFAVATALARAGDSVIVAGRGAVAAQAAADKLQAEGFVAESVVLDVDSPANVAAAADEVRQRHGRVDVVVNNAGILPEATDGDEHEFASVDLFAKTFQTNVFGPVAVIEAFLPLLRNASAGRIVNVSSTAGSLVDQADPHSPYYQLAVPAYQSSKAALNSVTIGLSKRLADTAIKVTSVCPGFVQTDLTPINREQAPLTAEQAAEIVVTAATLPADAPSGTFIDRDGVVPW
jgi:NAD(P)-dependent dehydrogenase (short-subunit alcohol dehydrogenase family)